MSSNNPQPPSIGFIDLPDAGSSNSPLKEQEQHPRPKIKLTWIDKIFRFLYSKEEFEAYLIEKELKRKAKQEREIDFKQASAE